MIFSAERKPTEPGWRWWRNWEQDPYEIVEVRQGNGHLLVVQMGDEAVLSVERQGGLWGDRVEFPASLSSVTPTEGTLKKLKRYEPIIDRNPDIGVIPGMKVTRRKSDSYYLASDVDALLLSPAVPTEGEMPDVQEPLEHVRDLCEFAFKHGYHELGYDPVEILERRLRSREAPNVDAVRPYSHCGRCGCDYYSHRNADMACPTGQLGGYTPSGYKPPINAPDYLTVEEQGPLYDAVNEYRSGNSVQRAKAVVKINAAIMEIVRGRSREASSGEARDPLRQFAIDMAEAECTYGDNCPQNAGTRHGVCYECAARRALLASGKATT